MSAADRERWDARHAAADDVGPLPPDALRGRPDLLPDGGWALDVACGRGVVTRWLALRGCTVDAVDASPVGLDTGARALAAESADAALRVRWILGDLDAGLPVLGPYDLVVCQRFRDPALYPALRRVLAPGGLLAVTVLSEVDEGPGPFRALPGELVAAFGDLDVVVEREGDGEATIVVRAPRGSPPAPPAPS